jgi:hypothetical protein
VGRYVTNPADEQAVVTLRALRDGCREADARPTTEEPHS